MAGHGKRLAATYEAWACPDDHVHVEHTLSDGTLLPLVFVDPDEAYAYAQSILRAYDEAVGIAPPSQ